MYRRPVLFMAQLLAAAPIAIAATPPHPAPGAFTAPLVASPSRPDFGRASLIAAELAKEFSEACPFAEARDQKALMRCKARLFHTASALRKHLPEFVLWGRMRVPDPVLKESTLTQFGPDVFSGTYAPLFMFNGQYKIQFIERENLYRIDFVSAFRNRLEPGLYPYPFWHEEDKWATYQGANRLSVYVGIDTKAGTEKIKAMQFSTFGENHAHMPARIETPVFDKDTHAKWLWTDKHGKTQPQVTLFDGMFSAGNPNLASLDETYRAMALEFRNGDCMSCHVPNNPDKMKRLVLLQTPAHAAAEIARVIQSVKDDKMPMDEFGIEKPMPRAMKDALLARAEAFNRALVAARRWEQEHAVPTPPSAKRANTPPTTATTARSG
jgi:hypothetical protein